MIQPADNVNLRRFAIILAMIGMTLLLTVCGGSAVHVEQGAAAHGEHAAPAAAPAAVTAEYSVYDLATPWLNQHGERRALTTLAGKPQVVAMVYTHCAYTCPRVLADLKRIEGQLGERADDVGFVLVSLDPARDTPERLREFATSAYLTPPRWTLFTAESEDAVLELATLLGVRYRRISETEFEHSNVLTVVDAHGGVVHQQFGLGSDPAGTINALQTLLP